MACPPSVSTRTVFSNWLVLLVLCAIIFIQSHGLVLNDIPLPKHLDKVLHFTCFSVLAVLFFRAYHSLPVRSSVKILVIISALSTILYGVGDELHQSFVPLRVSDGWTGGRRGRSAVRSGRLPAVATRARRLTEPSSADQCFS